MSILALAYCSQKSKLPLTITHAISSGTDVLLNWLTEHTGLKPGKKSGIWQKLFPVLNTNLRYCLTSEQMLVQQASWYMVNRVITLLIHLLPQHGRIQGNCAKIWEQTLPWLNQRMKTNLFPTYWEILATTSMDGLDCIGKMITNFIGLMAALRREIIRNGTTVNQMTVEATKIVCIFLREATLENGMT